MHIGYVASYAEGDYAKLVDLLSCCWSLQALALM
jgi:hypothetical protein